MHVKRNAWIFEFVTNRFAAIRRTRKKKKKNTRTPHVMQHTLNTHALSLVVKATVRFENYKNPKLCIYILHSLHVHP